MHQGSFGAAGVASFLTKPYTADTLLRMLRETLPP